MSRQGWFATAAAFAVFLAVSASLQAEPSAVPAQDSPVLSSKTRMAYPTPDPKIAEWDAEAAVAEIEARERDEELIRKTVRQPDRRLDLDHDVVQGIQSRNIENALRR